MTLAVAKSLIVSTTPYEDLHDNSIKYMKMFGKFFPGRGYGGNFSYWKRDINV